jgi:hypothetical protein
MELWVLITAAFAVGVIALLWKETWEWLVSEEDPDLTAPKGW